MNIKCNTNVKDIVEKLNKNIFNWYEGKEKYLNIISPPYNCSEIFLDIILKVIKNHGKVLYLTAQEDYSEILLAIKNNTYFRNYTCVKRNSLDLNSSLIICSFNLVNQINCKFDLIICDNISSMLKYTNEEVRNIIDNQCLSSGKVISYAIESLFLGYSELDFPIRKNVLPIIEPTTFFTRIDINKDIPYVVYEYINWSITINKKVIIYVPDREKVMNVYGYLYKLKNKIKCSVDFYIEDMKDSKSLINFSKKKGAILVTNYFGEKYLNFKSTNIMVYFADDERFDYKKLVYLSGRVDFIEKFEKGEVIFLAKKETEDINLAKSITRKFNKEAWDMGLLSI